MLNVRCVRGGVSFERICGGLIGGGWKFGHTCGCWIGGSESNCACNTVSCAITWHACGQACHPMLMHLMCAGEIKVVLIVAVVELPR